MPPRDSAPAHLRRRLLAGGGLAAGLIGISLAVGALPGGDEPASDVEEQAGPQPVELPRGGRAVLPDHRVVAYYGAPQSRELGVLGIGSPDRAARRLERLARRYATERRPVLPALELIAVIANAHAGDDGMFRTRQPDAVIRRYLRAARRHRMLLLLDIQPGRSNFFTEATRLERWLREPDVGLALDPEWRVTEEEEPGAVIGQVDAREVNATSAWLAQLVDRHDLPQKLFVVHQFTDDMVDAASLKRRDELAMVLNADGLGTKALKIVKYREFTRGPRRFQHGFKLFYEEDVGLMSPRDVMRLRPAPDLVIYE